MPSHRKHSQLLGDHQCGLQLHPVLCAISKVSANCQRYNLQTGTVEKTSKLRWSMSKRMFVRKTRGHCEMAINWLSLFRGCRQFLSLALSLLLLSCCLLDTNKNILSLTRLLLSFPLLPFFYFDFLPFPSSLSFFRIRNTRGHPGTCPGAQPLLAGAVARLRFKRTLDRR